MSNKKGKGKKGNDDDFLDDLLAETKSKTAAANAPSADGQPSKAALKRQKAKEKADAEAEALRAQGIDPEAVAAEKAAEKKRLADERKQQEAEEKKKKDEEAAAARAAAAAAKKPAVPSAAQARFALIKAQQEAAKRAAEEKKAQEEAIRAEVARLEAEAKAEAEGKSAARRQERERRRQEGTLLTKAQKEKQAAMERARAQFLASGMVPAAAAAAIGGGSASGDGDAASGASAAVAAARKKQQQSARAPQKTKAQIEAERIRQAAEKAAAEREEIRARAAEEARAALPAEAAAVDAAAAKVAEVEEELAQLKASLPELKEAAGVADASESSDNTAAAADGADAAKGEEAAADEPADDWEEEVADEWDAEEPSADTAAAATADADAADPALVAAKAALAAAVARIDAIEADALPAARAALTAAEEAFEEKGAAVREEAEARLVKEAEETRKKEAAARAAAAAAEVEDASSKAARERGMRSPILVILGHVDSGKTSLLDKVRNSAVAKGEAGGITQQISATNIPSEAIEMMMRKLPENERAAAAELPGMLMIDTPGHESFAMLRQRGSAFCDLAILIVDIQKGLQQQTIESINILKERGTPFIVAITKVDALYGWPKDEANAWNPIQQSMKAIPQSAQDEFHRLMNHTFAAFAEQHINVLPFWELDSVADPTEYHPIVPVSSKSGEGIPDLLSLVVSMSRRRLQSRLDTTQKNAFQCTVLEVNQMEGHGTVLDVILINGQLKEDDTIVCAGIGGPIVSRVRTLLMPPPLKEMRRTDYIAHPMVRAATGVKIAGPGLSGVLAGSSLFVCGPRDNIEDLKDQVQEDLQSVISKVDMNQNGVFVHASSLGSLEALLSFLSHEGIPVAGFDIGIVHRTSVTKASIQLDRRRPEYAVLLAFDVKVEPEAAALAARMGVQIFSADVIYTLSGLCTNHFKQVRENQRAAAKPVFPVVVKPMGKNFVFHNTEPVVLGVRVIAGTLRLDTPLFIPQKGNLVLGRVTSIKKDNKPVTTANKTDEVSISIDQSNISNPPVYGRQFDDAFDFLSHMNQDNIDALNEFYADELTETDQKLITKFKELFKI